MQPKFRYIIVTPDNSVLGTNDLDEAASFADDETFVIDVVEGKFSFDNVEQKVEAAS